MPQGAEEADGDSLDPRRPRSDRPRRRLDQDLRRLSLGRARRGGADVLARGDEARSSRRRAAAAARSSRTRAPPKACAAPSSAGVETIEHGDAGTPEVFKLMKEHNVALCPTLAAGDATSQYAGWKKGEAPGAGRHHAQARQLQGGARRRRHDPQRQRRRRLHARRQRARAGADGRLRHAARRDALKSATSVAARVLHMENRIGTVKEGPAGRPGRRRTAIPRATSRRCARCGS